MILQIMRQRTAAARRTFMKVIIVCLLTCLSVCVADTNDIQVVTTTNTNISPGRLITYDEFTRGGQTNLLRVTGTKDGVLADRAHNFYHDGAYVGRYTHEYAGGHTFISSAPNSPFILTFVFDSAHQPMSALILTKHDTHYVVLDEFTYTNGVFYPKDNSSVQKTNTETRDFLLR